MGIQDLQTFLSSHTLEGGAVSVDLLRIARNISQRQQPHNTNRKIRPLGATNKLKLIVDAENCLDRLYGGYYSDWACGGQWNRMVQFLALLCHALEQGNIEIAAVFNGTIEQCRMEEWKEEQANIRQKVGMVLKHINTKATPPPKIWWTPPITLRSALRMALRHLGVTVMCTMDDHHQEVIAYCREIGFHGLLADDAEYAAFDPPRYFSSENLKLTLKSSIETKEYMLSVLNKTLNLTQEQICVMVSLMGNFLLPESDLQDLHKRIGLKKEDNNQEQIIRSLAEFVRTLPPVSNMDDLLTSVFGNLEDNRCSKFRQSIQYYLNGTASGFLNYSAPIKQKQEKKEPVSPKEDLDESGFASETSEQQRETLQNYNLLTANTTINEFSDMDLLIKSADDGLQNGQAKEPTKILKNKANLAKQKNSNIVSPSVSADVLRTASLRHQKGLMVPTILHVLSTQEVRLPCLMEDESNREFPPIYDIYLPLRQRVYAVLFNLHHLRYVDAKKKGNPEIDSSLNYKYGQQVIRNYSPEKGEIPQDSAAPDVVVKEWVYSRSNPYQKPELVKAEQLPWAVPTLQRLWFGPAVDDKRRRMRAFLSCLNSDTPLILNTSFVPQHCLIMACVLRYIMSQDRPILRRNELDAFLCQAFNPQLMNVQYLQELTLNVVSSRGVQLAALFMKGVDMAILANDTCGAPLPWLMCCPWLYFDGKLFHYTLTRSTMAKNILEVCDNYIERVVKVERMRKAILEGLDVKFAKVMPPHFQAAPLLRPPGIAYMPTLAVPSNRGRAIPRGGGQLQVAGVVVGQWGANYGVQNGVMRQQQGQQMLPAGMAAYRGAPRGRGMYNTMGRGRGPPKPPTFSVANRRQGNKKRTNKSNKDKKMALTVKTDNGDVPVNELVLEGGVDECQEEVLAHE